MLSMVLMSVALGSGLVTGHGGRPDDLMARARAYELARSRGAADRLALHAMIPSFARQTGLACSACHTTFPQLSPLGRLFKLNGYTLTGLKVIQTGDSGQRSSLRLDLIPPVSAMVLTSLTQMRTAVPGTQNASADYPQELSLFIAGGLSERMGTFVQMSYQGKSGSFGIDNAELRFVGRAELANKGVLYGVTLNNNPTSQDVWNSAPAWRFPMVSSNAAPHPAAAPLLEGVLSHQVAGLGAYALLNGQFYAEYSAYRSAPQGGAVPPGQGSSNTIQGVGSYWRGFVEHIWGDQTLMVGTLGMAAKLYPSGVIGPVNRYTDVSFDAQYERHLGKNYFSTHGAWLHERQHLDAAFAAGQASHAENILNTLRLDAGILTPGRVGLTLGYFNVSGSADRLAYAGGPVGGSLAGRPDSRGVIGELSYMPWLNTRFAMQYTAYSRFNGAGSNYDGTGRNPGDNNTLYLSAWVVF